MAPPVQTGRRGRGDRGVAVVEFALVLPVLMVLVLGMFSGGIAWNQNQAIGQGARVAARFASTLPLPEPVTDADMDLWLEDIADRALAAAEDQMGAGVAGRSVCVAYVEPGPDPLVTTDDSTRSWTLGAASGVDAPCFADDQGDEARVQVVMERDSVLNIGFYQQTLHLRRETVYRYELQGGL